MLSSLHRWGSIAVAATAIQLASVYAAIANRGLWIQPHLVDHVQGVQMPAPETRRILPRPVDRQLLAMLKGVVSDVGTAAAAQIPGYSVAGKTGTAQMIANSKASRGEDHAWFAAFAPAKEPEVVVVVLVERGGKGGQVAAPIARKILNAIFFEKVASAGLSG